MRHRVHPQAAATLAQIPPEFHGMTLPQILAHFADGRPVPASMPPWLRAADKLAAAVELKRRNDSTEAELRGRGLLRRPVLS